MTKLGIAGLLLIGGSALTLALHFADAPEDAYRCLHDHVGGAALLDAGRARSG